MDSAEDGALATATRVVGEDEPSHLASMAALVELLAIVETTKIPYELVF